jgi:hypothetical protein
MRILIWALLLCHFCSAQTIRVRVINGDDGHPLPKQAVSVQFLYEKPVQALRSLDIETDGHGEAQFNIPEPAPGHISIRITLSSEHWHCACWVMANTERVVREGIVHAGAAKKTPAASTNAQPGQIIFIASPFTFFERLLYPLVKD